MRIQRFVIGGGNDQPATVQVGLLITAHHQLPATAQYQFTQLVFDLRSNHPQHRTGVGQQPGFAQGNLPATNDQHTAAAQVMKQRQKFHLADDLNARHVRLEHFRYTDRTVGLLVVFQHGNQGTAYSQALNR